MELTVDGKKYNVIVTSLTRKFQVLDGENAERTLSGAMIRDIIGTFYNYEITILPAVGKYGDYDALYEVLSAPQDSHRIVVPYAQSTLTFNAYARNPENHTGRDFPFSLSQWHRKGRDTWEPIQSHILTARSMHTM